MKKLSGFTLVEVIVVVAVLAVVLTIATPDLNRLFAKQDEMTESLRLKKIYAALEIYSKQKNTLPAEATWVDDLVQYSELSRSQIENDVWGNPRDYKLSKGTMEFLETDYEVNYAVVHSAGYDGSFNSKSTPANKNDFINFDPSKDSSGNRIDNQAIKYTDQSEKIELLEITLDRMEKLSIALAKYARVKQINGIKLTPSTSDKYIYFPKDGSGNKGVYFDTDIDKEDGSGKVDSKDAVEVLGGNANEATELAKILGLPEYYGENALTGNPLWYISNPSDNAGSICVGEEEEAPYNPPVIMIYEADPDNGPC